MLYMNDYDMSLAKMRHEHHPVLSRAAQFLDRYREEVDAHSDGWAYWRPAVQAARALMLLLQGATATESDFSKALKPIKSFYTRRGYDAGMKFPEIK